MSDSKSGNGKNKRRTMSFRVDAELEAILDRTVPEGMKPSAFIRLCIRDAERQGLKHLFKLATAQKELLEVTLKDLANHISEMEQVSTKLQGIEAFVEDKKHELQSLQADLLRQYEAIMKLMRELRLAG